MLKVLRRLDKIEIYNGILSGKLIKVEDYTKLGIDAIDKNGYWFAIKFDQAGASAEGYSEVKFFGEEAELADGVNYVFMGRSQEDVASKVLSVSSEYTPVNAEEGSGEGGESAGGEDGSSDSSEPADDGNNG